MGRPLLIRCDRPHDPFQVLYAEFLVYRKREQLFPPRTGAGKFRCNDRGMERLPEPARLDPRPPKALCKPRRGVCDSGTRADRRRAAAPRRRREHARRARPAGVGNSHAVVRPHPFWQDAEGERRTSAPAGARAGGARNRSRGRGDGRRNRPGAPIAPAPPLPPRQNARRATPHALARPPVTPCASYQRPPSPAGRRARRRRAVPASCRDRRSRHPRTSRAAAHRYLQPVYCEARSPRSLRSGTCSSLTSFPAASRGNASSAASPLTGSRVPLCGSAHTTGRATCRPSARGCGRRSDMTGGNWHASTTCASGSPRRRLWIVISNSSSSCTRRAGRVPASQGAIRHSTAPSPASHSGEDGFASGSWSSTAARQLPGTASASPERSGSTRSGEIQPGGVHQ